MDKKTFTVKELELGEDNQDFGVQAISFVPDPAIMTTFEYYARIRPPFWKWVADPPVESTTRDFCKDRCYDPMHANHKKGYRSIYHTDEIKEWANQNDGTFIEGSTMFAAFSDDSTTFNGDEQLYNCRHRLERVSSLDEVPESVLKRVEKKNLNFGADQMFFNFAIENKEKKQVKGLALQSHQMIYRSNADGQGNPGFNYMTSETIRKIKDRYGYNRKITFCHREDITGYAILLDSWLEEDGNTKWFLKYQIMGDKLWAQITSGNVRGFSVEMIMKFANFNIK
jgi:hypothetical protein